MCSPQDSVLDALDALDEAENRMKAARGALRRANYGESSRRYLQKEARLALIAARHQIDVALEELQCPPGTPGGNTTSAK